MARNKKNTKWGEGKSDTIVIRLDQETKNLWTAALKHRNMSDWFRGQLKYHFSDKVPTIGKILALKEEMLIVQKERDNKILKIEEKYEVVIKLIHSKIKELENEVLKEVEI